MRYASVCSGIEAASVAWEPLGWDPVFFAEIEKFPSTILSKRWPGVPNLRDFTTIRNHWLRRIGLEPDAIDLLVGGTPCQSFSLAGRRLGLDDARGNLALEFIRLAYRLSVRWTVFENVPGLLSSDKGRDFGAFLAAFAGYPAGFVFEPPIGGWRNAGIVEPAPGNKRGYGLCWRVLDAQYVRTQSHPRAVPQRRRRLFVVGYSGDWRPSAAILAEPEGLRGYPAPCRQAGEAVAALTANGAGTCGADDNQAQAGHIIPFGGNNTSGPIEVATACNAHGVRQDFETETLIAFDCKASASHMPQPREGITPPLRAMNGKKANGGGQLAVAINLRGREEGNRLEIGGEHASALRAGQGGSDKQHVFDGAMVRRITPREYERLQGFPDDYTAIPWRGKPADQCPDGPRYKACGNSMAVNVMSWLGERIDLFEKKVRKQYERSSKTVI